MKSLFGSFLLLSASDALTHETLKAGKGDLNGAKKAYAKALKVDRTCFEAHVNTARINRDLGRLPDALKNARKAVDIRPKDTIALVVLGERVGLVARATPDVEELARDPGVDAPQESEVGADLVARHGLGPSRGLPDLLEVQVEAFLDAVDAFRGQAIGGSGYALGGTKD